MKVVFALLESEQRDEEGHLLIDDNRASDLVPFLNVLPPPMSLQTIAPDKGGMSNNLDDLSVFVFDDFGALAASPHPPLAIFLVRLHMPPQVAQPRSRGLVPADWAGGRTWRNVVANLVVDDDRCGRWRVGTRPLPWTGGGLAVL